jgi:hypothetical protein
MAGAGRLDLENKSIAHLFSETPRLTHVVRAQIAAPQDATWILVLPSPRAQSPSNGASLASGTPLAPILSSAANAAGIRNMRLTLPSIAFTAA